MGRLYGPHPGTEIQISGRKLSQRDVMLLSPELVDPTFRQRDPHGHVFARYLTPGFRVRVWDHHVCSYFDL